MSRRLARLGSKRVEEAIFSAEALPMALVHQVLQGMVGLVEGRVVVVLAGILGILLLGVLGILLLGVLLLSLSFLSLVEHVVDLQGTEVLHLLPGFLLLLLSHAIHDICENKAGWVRHAEGHQQKR